MNADQTPLLDLLRAELDATNQQFTHILALRELGYKTTAARIVEVDDIDFSNSMGIIDHLIKSGVEFTLPAPEFNPGSDYASILRAEQMAETRLTAVLAGSTRVSATAAHLIARAKAPRADYATWLADAIAGTDKAETTKDSANALEGLVAQLITMIEQSMIHAFVEWHGDNQPAADAAWQTSGAAMMQLTRLVRLFARRSEVLRAGSCPAAQLCHQAGATLQADLELARNCAQQADNAAADYDHPKIAQYCTSIARYYHGFVNWSPSTNHPATDSNPPVFHSFAATLEKFIA